MGDRELSDDELAEVSPHVHLQIPQQKKVKWRRYADENFHRNLSAMVEEAVDMYLSDEWMLASEVEESQEVDVDLDGIEELRSEISALRDDIDSLALQNQVGDEEDINRDDLIQLANRIKEILPVVPHHRYLGDITKLPGTLELSERVKITGIVEDLASFLNKDKIAVRNACLFLERNEIENVESVIDAGARRWYVKNENVDVDEVYDDIDIEDDELEYHLASDL